MPRRETDREYYGRLLSEAADRRDNAPREIAQLTREARAAGVPMRELAESARTSRQALYALLDRYPASPTEGAPERHQGVQDLAADPNP